MKTFLRMLTLRSKYEEGNLAKKDREGLKEAFQAEGVKFSQSPKAGFNLAQLGN